MYRKIMSIALAIVMLGFVPGVAPASPVVNLDGVTMSFENQPVEVNGRLLVPMRELFEALGAELSWDEGTETVTAYKDGQEIVIRAGEYLAYIDGQEVALDVPALQLADRTMVPLRFVAEALQCTVRWDDEAQIVYIDTGNSQPAAPQKTYGTIAWNDGTYTGYLVGGIPEGKGTLKYANLDVYEGDFLAGQRSGQGRMEYFNGDLYEGEWADDLASGQGVFTWKNGNQYTGPFVLGMPNGIGTFTWTLGSRYAGNFVAGKKSGQGILYYYNGNRYEGLFTDDKVSGEGFYYLKSGQLALPNYPGRTASNTNLKGEYLPMKPPLKIYANDGTNRYLGTITRNEKAAEGIYNEDGEYGSVTGVYSIWNQNSSYGYLLSNYGPWYSGAVSPPMIIDARGNIVGYYTRNTSIVGAVNPYMIDGLMADLNL